MKFLGQLLLWSGFLVGSLATVLNSEAKGVKFVKGLTPEYAKDHRYGFVDLSSIPVPEDGWHLIPWAWYIPAALVCVVGIVLIRLGTSSEGKKSDKTEASLAEIKTSLGHAIAKVDELSGQVKSDSLAPSKIAERIDDIAEDLRIFADGRDSITAEYGLNTFADVMTKFASGERTINRAWSASADGYLDEASQCIERAAMLFKDAANELDQAGK